GCGVGHAAAEVHLMADRQEDTRLGAALSDLNAAWQDRLADAQALLATGRHAWAIATALYALEIRLKVLICRKLDLQQLPRAFEIHDLDGLFLLVGLSGRLQRRRARGVKANWDSMTDLGGAINDLRYRPAS